MQEFLERLRSDRRTWLALSAAGFASSLVAQAEAARPPKVIRDDSQLDNGRSLELLARLAARADEKMTYWLTRGRDYGLVGGKLAQIGERRIVLAKQVKWMPDGGLKYSYSEQSFGMKPGGSEFSREIISPFTGKTVANTTMMPFKQTLTVTPTGHVGTVIRTDTIEATYDGWVNTQLAPDGAPTVDLPVYVEVRQGETRSHLVELGPIQGDPDGERNGFVPARRFISVYQELPQQIAGNEPGVLLMIGLSAKFATLEKLTAALTAVERKAFAPWFEQAPAIMARPEDFVPPAG
jgi:hypothetical protein